MTEWWSHLLVTGSVLLVVPTAVLVLSLRWGWPAFEEDYPDDVRALLPEPTRAEKLGGGVLGVAFLISLLTTLVVTTATWPAAQTDFRAAWLMALGAVVLFCLIDLVFVDWILICTWRPAWVMPRGTESAPGWGDHGFHLRAQLAPKGLAVLAVGPLVLAAVVRFVL